MRKLFLFIAAALVSTSLWADVTLFSTDFSDDAWEGITGICRTASTNADTTYNGITFHSTGSSPAKPFLIDQPNGKMTWCNNNMGNNFWIAIPITGVNGSITITIANGSTATRFKYAIKQETSISGSPGSGSNNANSSANPATVTINDLNKSDYVVYLGRQGSGLTQITSITITTPAPACVEPNASIISDQPGYVGDTIDLDYSSSNTSAVVWNIKLDDEATTEGVDYAWVNDSLKVLKVGTYVVTATQATDGTHCAVEAGDATVTLAISATTPISAVEVKGPATAHIGEEVTLTAVADNGIDTIYWTLNGILQNEEHSSTLTFTPNEAGNYTYAAYVRNQFNTAGQWINDDTTVVVAVGTDATLSDLKVNGTTVAGFASGTYAYNVGEIGVYELLTVTATPTDDPYASAVVADDSIDHVTVTVTAENLSTQDYVINYTRAAATVLDTISGNTEWDWSKAGSKTTQLSDNTLPTKNEEFNFADVLSGQDASFKAEALIGVGQFANGDGYAQANKLKFHTAVPGSIVVKFSNTGSSSRPDRYLLVNDVQTEYKSATSKSEGVVTTGAIEVAAGDVVLEALEMKETPVKNMLRYFKITFSEAQKYDISCEEAEHGEVTASPTSTYAGYPVNLTTNPATGYELATLTVLKASDDSDITDDVLEGNVLTMPAYAVKVVATFSAKPYDITIDDAIENGSVTAKVGGVAAATATIGQTVTLDVEPTSANYSISSVTMNGEAVTKTAGVYSFEMPAQNVTVSATFAEKDAAPIYWKLNEVVVDAAEVTYGSTPYALPALTNTESLTVALESSATDVAEFDGSTLNIKKAGTANISATYTATADGDYRTTVVSYALTVKSGSGTSLDNTAAEIKAVKFIENGQLFIRRGEKVYTITGELVK